MIDMIKYDIGGQLKVTYAVLYSATVFYSATGYLSFFKSEQLFTDGMHTIYALLTVCI